MANRKYVERVRDRLSGVLDMMVDMNKGEFDGRLELALADVRSSAANLDAWLAMDRERRRREEIRYRLRRVDENCVIRRRRTA